MSGIFEHLSAFDDEAQVATRQAIAVANKRFNDKFAGFLRQASTKKEFASRLALVDTDINNMIEDVVNEYGGDAAKIAAAVKKSFEFTPDAWSQAVDYIIQKYGTQRDTEENARLHLNEAKDQIMGGINDPNNVQEIIQALENFYRINDLSSDSDRISSRKLATCDCDGNCKGECSCGGCDTCKCASKKTASEYCQNCGGYGCEQCSSNPDQPGPWKPTPCEKHGDINCPECNYFDGPFKPNQPCEAHNVPNCPNCTQTLYGQMEQHTGSDDSKRPERLKAQDEIQLADEHSQVPPWLKKQIQDEDQEDGGNLRNKTADMDSQPIANPVPLAKTPGYTAGGDSIEKVLENAPSAVGTGVLSNYPNQPLPSGEMQAQPSMPGTCNCNSPDCETCKNDPGKNFRKKLNQPTFASAHKVEKKDNKFYVTEKGEGEVAGPFDSQEDAYARANELNDLENLEKEAGLWDRAKGASVTPAMARALELKHAADVETGDKTEEREKLPKGNEDALGGPSPKIDKKKWVPNATNPDGNLEPIDTEGNNSPVPTRHMDIKQKPDYQQDTLENLEKYDNNVWSREDLPSADDNSGFNTERNISQDGQSGTFPNKGQTNPVTRKALAAWYDEDSLFRRWLADHGIELFDHPDELKQSPVIRSLWKQFVQDVPAPSEGDVVPGKREDAPIEEPTEIPVDEPVVDESPVEDLIEEPLEEPVEEEAIIEETPEDVEEIIEREDKEGDRVEVIDEGDEDVDLLTDEELEDLEDFEEIDPFENVEDMDDDEISRLIRDYDEDSDDEDRY